MIRRKPGPQRRAGPCPDGLLCALTLDPSSLPRNRFFWVYEEPRARRAHGRAHALRRLHDQIAALLRQPGPRLTVREEDLGVFVSYRDESLALDRRVHLGPIETALLRLLLARDGLATPSLLEARTQDRLLVAAALDRLRTYPGLPDPSGWSDVLAPIAPAAGPSNTTE